MANIVIMPQYITGYASPRFHIGSVELKAVGVTVGGVG